MKPCVGQGRSASVEDASGSAGHLTVPRVRKRAAKTSPPVVCNSGPDLSNESPEAAAFRKKWYSGITYGQWNSWRWQIAHRLESTQQLKKMFTLSNEEHDAIDNCEKSFPFAITPYYASQLSPDNPADPLRKTVIPVAAEYVRSYGESDDPLCEDAMSPVPGIIHRYPDRVLFLVTPWCSTYCRYCTRSRMVGNHTIALKPYKSRITKALAYIAGNPAIRDVLLSGGDPLTLDNVRLEWILREVRSIPHVEIIRIGTKVPVVLPQRITADLVNMLRCYHPLWMSIHVTHPKEVTPEMRRACGSLADAGIPLGSQTVLLSGVNDDRVTLRDLFHKLMRIRVKPYYLYQCDPITGSAHFRTSVEKGVRILSSLQGHTSGYAVPRYVIDAPGGGGKIPIEPDRRCGRDGDMLNLINYEGNRFTYPDTVGMPLTGELTNPG
jgi:lysine 2,3-aminomutase